MKAPVLIVLTIGLALTNLALAQPQFSPLPQESNRANISALLEHPILSVVPRSLDFGWVAPGSTATNTFLVENAGGGTLIGRAVAPPPFRIVQGGAYHLPKNSSQVVTITFTPARGGTNIAAVTFTGGGGATNHVIGRSALIRPRILSP